MFDRLAKVAPGDLEDDVKSVRDGLKEQADAVRSMGAGNIFAPLIGGFISSVQHSGSAQIVDAYINNNCDLSFRNVKVRVSK